MELTDSEKQHLLAALGGTAKSALSVIPGLAQAIAGWDSYRRSQFDRSVLSAIRHLTKKIENVEIFFNAEWFRSEEGQQFAWKVLDSALDAQIEEKQELFINALIQGGQNQDISILEKFKFVDMLRHLSKASLMVLADMHEMYIGQVRSPGRSQDQVMPLAQIDATRIAERLSNKYHPYLVTAAINELESQGLFSRTGEWLKRPDGGYSPGAGFMTELCYTDFAARFVEFIMNASSHVPRKQDTSQRHQH
jgi:hypothetical protein